VGNVAVVEEVFAISIFTVNPEYEAEYASEISAIMFTSTT
jgi:hypothetical protein